MTHWKTTIFGLLAAAAAFIDYAPEYFPAVVQDLAGFIMIGGLAGLGITAAQVVKSKTR